MNSHDNRFSQIWNSMQKRRISGDSITDIDFSSIGKEIQPDSSYLEHKDLIEEFSAKIGIILIPLIFRKALSVL